MKMKGQFGFSLSELLVGLLLASIIMAALIQFYLGSKRQYMEAEQILSTQFDVLWVSDLLANSIRRAGFTPCVGVDHLSIVDRRDMDKQVIGLSIENLPGQQVLVNRMSEEFTELISIISPNQLLVSKEVLFNEQRPLIIADCEHAEIHQVLSSTKMGSRHLITLTKPLIYSYAIPTYIGEWFEEKWFIQNNARGEASLFYKLLKTEELSPLIHSMRIKDQKKHKKRVLEVVMGLEKDKEHSLLVAVRAS